MMSNELYKATPCRGVVHSQRIKCRLCSLYGGVLEVYSRPYDKAYPVLCMDEKPLQLLAEARSGHRKKNGTYIQIANMCATALAAYFCLPSHFPDFAMQQP